MTGSASERNKKMWDTDKLLAVKMELDSLSRQVMNLGGMSWKQRNRMNELLKMQKELEKDEP